MSIPKGRFPLPEFKARVDGCQKMHPSSRAVNSARELGPWTRVVETGLNGTKTLMRVCESFVRYSQRAVILYVTRVPASRHLRRRH